MPAGRAGSQIGPDVVRRANGSGRPSTRHLDAREAILQLRDILRSQLHLQRAKVLFEMIQLGRARYRYDPRFLREQPGERDLSRSGVLAPAYAL